MSGQRRLSLFLLSLRQEQQQQQKTCLGGVMPSFEQLMSAGLL